MGNEWEIVIDEKKQETWWLIAIGILEKTLEQHNTLMETSYWNLEFGQL